MSRYVCPSSTAQANGEPHTVIGCGRPFISEPDDEGIVDCPLCGIWFNPNKEHGGMSSTRDLGDGLIEVTFRWTDRLGVCEECGLPAAFLYVDAYGPGKHMKCDAICAANFATEGAAIVRIEED